MYIGNHVIIFTGKNFSYIIRFQLLTKLNIQVKNIKYIKIGFDFLKLSRAQEFFIELYNFVAPSFMQGNRHFISPAPKNTHKKN